jgi:hypothetical protein
MFLKVKDHITKILLHYSGQTVDFKLLNDSVEDEKEKNPFDTRAQN